MSRRDMVPLRRMKSSGIGPPGSMRAVGKKQKVEGQVGCGGVVGDVTLPADRARTQQVGTTSPGIAAGAGNLIKHSADMLAMGIWAPPGPPAHLTTPAGSS